MVNTKFLGLQIDNHLNYKFRFDQTIHVQHVMQFGQAPHQQH
jgi:hypothetical protein